LAAPYSEASDVMAILQTTDESLETEIEACITEADALIDSLLEPYGLTVPDVTPQNIKDACAYFAAWLFRKRRDPGAADVFKQEAETILQAYVDKEAEVAFKVVSDQ
jgi:hypothetical protein